jgi:hypothetical protein
MTQLSLFILTTKQQSLSNFIKKVRQGCSFDSTSPEWNIIYHKAKVQKEGTFIWLVVYKAIPVNEW